MPGCHIWRQCVLNAITVKYIIYHKIVNLFPLRAIKSNENMSGYLFKKIGDTRGTFHARVGTKKIEMVGT